MHCLPALDYLISDTSKSVIKVLLGRRVGLLTNHTGRSIDGISTAQALQNLGVEITTFFSPEHGPGGNKEGNIASSMTAEGAPIYSLYGETRQPTAEMLQQIDVFVCDLQDVGARFYTYISTLALAMEACAANGVDVVVLDRPNPLGGVEIVGPLRDKENPPFVGYLDIPIIHGMTMGEMALLHRADKSLDVDLHVIQIQHWQREMRWNDLRLPWRVPSPNLPDYRSAAWYSGLCLSEFSNVSVGRGTDAPFQIMGAPWMNAEKVLLQLQDWRDLLKSTFMMEPISFTPQRGKHENESCQGLRFDASEIPDSRSVIALGMAVFAVLQQLYPEEFDASKALPLIGSSVTLTFLLQGNLEKALALADSDARVFERRRQEFLLY